MSINVFDPSSESLDTTYVKLVHAREHEYVPRSKTKRPPCAICGGGRTTNIEHYGFPDSQNVLGSGNRFAYQGMKKMWQKRFVELLEQSQCPKYLGFVRTEGTLTFPTRAKRDQSNFRYMIEKALGDALQEGSPPWLTDDCWSRYQFGDLFYDYDKGVEKMELRLWLSDEPLALAGGAMAD